MDEPITAEELHAAVKALQDAALVCCRCGGPGVDLYHIIGDYMAAWHGQCLSAYTEHAATIHSGPENKTP
jgi:hypothetical protein